MAPATERNAWRTPDRRGAPSPRSPTGERAIDDHLVDPNMWETPIYSSTGERLVDDDAGSGLAADLYALIAGESEVVTTLRRALVNELVLPRSQVTFMGYWREGVAMRSCVPTR